MDINETLDLPFNVTGKDSSHLRNYTKVVDRIYIFTPAGAYAKIALCLISFAVGVLGFLGNCFVLYFFWQEPKKASVQSNRFIRNLRMYGKSLALSDILSCVASLPLYCIQVSFDVFQSGWACKIVRYLNILFSAISFNHLTLISFEKYLSIRPVPHTLRECTVRKVITCTWILGLVIVVFPAATFDGLRVDLNNTHYTIVCTYNQNYYPFKLSIILFPLQFLLPIVFVTYINIRLLITMWSRQRRRLASGVTDAFKAQLRVKSIKGTMHLVTLTFLFLVPHLFYLGYVTYTQVTKSQLDFQTEYLVRYASGGIGAYFSILRNFVFIYNMMADFRVFLKTFLCRRRNEVITVDWEACNLFTTDNSKQSRSYTHFYFIRKGPHRFTILTHTYVTINQWRIMSERKKYTTPDYITYHKVIEMGGYSNGWLVSPAEIG